MILSWQRLTFFAAALGMLAAAVLPLSSEPTPDLFARPGLLAVTLLAAALYAGAALVAPRLSIAVTLAGVVLSCCVTLALLRDPTIAGYATWGLWLPVLATWIAAWLGVARLAAVKPHDKAVSRIIDLAIPLLFGAFVFYLWEVAVRGFGLCRTVMRLPPKKQCRATR